MNNNIDLNALLKLASERLGMSAEELTSNIASGNMSKLSGRVGATELSKLQELIKNPEKAAELLSSPQAKLLMSLLQKRK